MSENSEGGIVVLMLTRYYLIGRLEENELRLNWEEDTGANLITLFAADGAEMVGLMRANSTHSRLVGTQFLRRKSGPRRSFVGGNSLLGRKSPESARKRTVQ